MQDYEKRPGVWGRPIVAIKVKPVGIADKDMFAAITLVVKVSGGPKHQLNLSGRLFDLRVICGGAAQFSPSYPRTVPVIELQQRKGLSDKEVAELQEMLDKKAAALVGDVMVYELYMVAGKAGAPGLPTMQRLAHRRRPPSLGEVVPPHDYG